MLNFLSSSTSQDCFRASTGSITSRLLKKSVLVLFPVEATLSLQQLQTRRPTATRSRRTGRCQASAGQEFESPGRDAGRWSLRLARGLLPPRPRRQNLRPQGWGRFLSFSNGR